MEKEQDKVKDFFDQRAEVWDSKQNDQTFATIKLILDRAEVQSTDTLLDVGCGTGVLIPFFQKKGVRQIFAVDFSREMVRLCKEKFPTCRVIEADYEKPLFKPETFSKIFVFNCFPHFRHPYDIFERSFSYLKTGGLFVIAHSMSREDINIHHKLAGQVVENDILMPDLRFQDYFKRAGFKDVIVENSHYFYASGAKY